MGDFLVILLEQKRFLILPQKWVEDPRLDSFTRVFFSPNISTRADFETEVKYYFNNAINGCYKGFVMKSFRNYEDASNFIEWKRPTFPIKYQSNVPSVIRNLSRDFSEPVEHIDISDEVRYN